MKTVKRVELELPDAIFFAIKSNRTKKDVVKEIKRALAIYLFREKVISLGKSAELAEMDRVDFMKLLKKFNIPSYAYSEEHYEQDKKVGTKYK